MPALRDRDDFLDAASALFAERGFYGVSLAQIAAELGVTKQAVIHRFGTKEKLYGEVLERISIRVSERLDQALDAGPSAADQLVEFFRLGRLGRTEGDTRLLVRELLDNKRRAERARTWYLEPFLEALIELVRRAPGWQDASRAQALAAVYQLLGADSYYEISSATLERIFGSDLTHELADAFPSQLERTIRLTLSRPPSD